MARPKNAPVKREARSPKSATAGKKTAPKRRFRPGTVALRQIRTLQSNTNFLLPRLSFQRVVREIMQNLAAGGSRPAERITHDALDALQVSSEQFLTDVMSNAQILTSELHKGRTLTAKSMRIAVTMMTSKGAIPVDKRPSHAVLAPRTNSSFQTLAKKRAKKPVVLGNKNVAKLSGDNDDGDADANDSSDADDNDNDYAEDSSKVDDSSDVGDSSDSEDATKKDEVTDVGDYL